MHKKRILIYNHNNINNTNTNDNNQILLKILILKIHNNYPSKQTLTEGEFGIQSGKIDVVNF